MIHNRLRELAAARATVHQQFATARRIVEQSGASRTTVYGLLHNRVRRLPLRDLELLCRWLDCQPGDLLYMEEEHATGEPDGFFKEQQWTAPVPSWMGEEHAQQIADQTSRKNERQD